MTINAAEAYLANKINTASPMELTSILYDGIIKFCNKAIIGLEENDIEKVHINIVKAQRIVEELQNTLNDRYPVSEDFNRIYNYINSRLIDANLYKEKEIIEEVLVHVRDLRDTWKEVMKESKVS